MARVDIVLVGALARIAREKKVDVEATTIHEALETLGERFGGEFKDRLFDDCGNPRRFINIYVNGRDARFIEGLETLLCDGDAVSLIPAVSGG